MTNITVKQFIEFLQTQDQDATVDVLTVDTRGNAKFANINLYDHIDYTDLRGNPWVKEGDAHYNKRYLSIGEINS